MADMNSPENRVWGEAMQRSTESNLAAAIAAAKEGDDPPDERIRAVLTGAFCAVIIRMVKHKPEDYELTDIVHSAMSMAIGYVAQIRLHGSEKIELDMAKATEPTPKMLEAGAAALKYIGPPARGYAGLARDCWNAMAKARFTS